MNDVPLVIYHGGCPDGFACRWIYQRFIHPPRCDDPEYWAGFYNEPPPDVTGRDVFIFDFSYKRPIMEKMAEEANFILCYDHHKTAQEDLEGLDWCVFDMSRSGCGILWDEWGAKESDNMFRRIGAQGQLWTGQLESKEMGFHGRPDRPAFLAYIEDRDLWNFKYQKSREINAAIYAVPMTMDGFDMLSRCTLDHLTKQGEVSLAVQAKLSESQAKKAMEVLFAGHRVPCASAPTMASETGHVLALDKPFSITWSMTQKGEIKFELRSSKEGGLDVGQIAGRMKGGGHRNAAGFHADWGQLTQMMQGFDIVPTHDPKIEEWLGSLSSPYDEGGSTEWYLLSTVNVPQPEEGQIVVGFWSECAEESFLQYRDGKLYGLGGGLCKKFTVELVELQGPSRWCSVPSHIVEELMEPNEVT